MTNFIATIKWGVSDFSPEIDDLPEDFKDVLEKAKNGTEGSLNHLSKYLRCTFVAGNIFSDLSEIVDADDEIEAKYVEITTVSFETLLPSVKAIAHFEIPIKNGVDGDLIISWQENNEMLDSGIAFQWDIPDLDEDLSLTNYSELSFEFVS